MKITQNPLNPTQVADKSKAEKAGASNKTTKEQGVSSAAAETASAVEISDKAKWMQMASNAARSAALNPPGKIEALKKAIQEGNYRVDADALADKILDEHLQSDFGKNNL